MQVKKPSPALVVSIVALVVAMSGTAIAAKVLITNSSQIANGTIRGVDIKKGTITKGRLSKGTIASLTGSSAPVGVAGSTSAVEVHRQSGPEVNDANLHEVASLSLQPGVYAVFAKTTISPFVTDDGLLDTLTRENKTAAAECTLDVNGTGDYAIQAITSFGTTNPATLNTQLTRTLDAPGTAKLTCRSSQPIRWQAANTSIIALKVGTTNRVEAAR